MSLSNLSSQLAALSSSNNGGFVTSSNRTNNEAIGRGFHHSIKHGHALTGPGLTSGHGDPTKKASVLFDDARTAAEVSTVTLRENAVAALEAIAVQQQQHVGGGGDDELIRSIYLADEFVNRASGLLSNHNLMNFERGTATLAQNQLIDNSIDTLLTLLGTLVCEHHSGNNGAADATANNPILTSILQIIEYLIRHYQIHARNNTAHMLLRTFLPIHLTHPQLFQRILSLIDLQSAGATSGSAAGTWAFLRQYAARGARPMNQKGLAKMVAREESLASVICDIGKRGSDVCLLEGGASNKGGGGGGAVTGALPVRRGISALISFSASVLIEALHIQSTTAEGNSGVKSGGLITGGVQESLVRRLFPLVVAACRGTTGTSTTSYCPEWKEWGRLVTSTLAILCPLKGEVKTAFCDAIVDGIPKTTSSSLSLKEVDDASSAIMTLLSVLSSDNTTTTSTMSTSNENDDWDYYLPMLPRGRRGNTTNIIDYLGCDFPSSTYRTISKTSVIGSIGSSDTITGIVSMAMGAIIDRLSQDNSDDDDDENGDAESNGNNRVMIERMAPMVASIVMHAFQRIEKEASKLTSLDNNIDGGDMEASSTKKKQKKRKSKGGEGDGKFKADKDVCLLLSLINEPSLAPLWNATSSALVAAVTVQTVTSYDIIMSQSNSTTTSTQSASTKMILDRYKSILEALSNVNASVKDQGVAYAINAIAKSASKDSSKKKSPMRMTCLASLLGHSDASSLMIKSDLDSTTTGASSSATDNITFSMVEDADLAASYLLPPRVALENALASVRLDAISRLEQSLLNNDTKLDGDLGQALLRRLVTDNDPVVAKAAGEIVASQLDQLLEEHDTMVEEDDDNAPSMAFASLEDDLTSLAKDALSAVYHWTTVGKDDSWSPESSMTNTKKKKEKKKPKDDDSTPLLSSLRICGSVAKLILDQESIQDMTSGMNKEDSTSHLFCMLILSLGAHVGSESQEVSKIASKELLQLSNNDDGCNTVTDLIAKHSIGSHVVQYIFIDKKSSISEMSKKRAASALVPLHRRFLWLALHSHSELLFSGKSDKSSQLAVASQLLDLMFFQMQSYTENSKKSDSFEWEVEFLGRNCGACLSLLAKNDKDELAKSIMQIASISSAVALKAIAKPAIISQLKAIGKTTEDLPGLIVLTHACLQPQASSGSISRILTIAKELFDASPDVNVASHCIIPALALLSHPERDVREHVLQLFESFQSTEKSGKKNEIANIVSSICSKVADKSSSMRSSLLMDGINSLPQLVGQIVLSSESSASIQKYLIESCKRCALAEKDVFWRSGSQASAVILSVMEKSGESAFPLSKRWEYAGKDLFQAFLLHDQKVENTETSLSQLRDCVVTMLKGVKVNQAQTGDSGLSIQISIGPSQTGRRMRSYSIGASEHFSVLESYPDEMVHAIRDALTSKPLSVMLSRAVIQLVVSRQSWAEGVFPNLDTKSRHTIASALLVLRTRDADEFAGAALSGLPLKSNDFIHLLKNIDSAKSESDQVAVTFITDCVRGKLGALGKISDVSKLSSKLFDQILALSSTDDFGNDSGDSGGRDYTRVSILQTLLAVHSHYKHELKEAFGEEGEKHHSGGGKRTRSHSDVGTSQQSGQIVASHASTLVGLVGGDMSTIHPLTSGRGRALSLALLTSLCEQSPSAVVTSLLPALMSLAGTSPSTADGEDAQEKKADMRAVGDALAAIVPAYCMHAHSANLSLFDLMESFVGKVVIQDSDNEKSRYYLLDHFVGALKQLPTKDESSDAVASLVACVIALEAFHLQDEQKSSNGNDSIMIDTEEVSYKKQTKPNLRVLANATTAMRIAVSLSLLQYAEKLMSVICGLSTFSAKVTSCGKMKVDVSEVVSLALQGANAGESVPSGTYSACSEAQKRSILYLVINLLQTVRDATSTPAARKLVRKSQGSDADLCLRLWQELMQTHVNTLRAHSKLVLDGSIGQMEKRFWDAAPIATSECLANLQNLLPVPHFLASVSSTLAEDSTDTYIRKKTIRLLADRVTEVSSDSPEALLFIEMVPELVSQVNIARPEISDEASLISFRRTIVMQQGALIAIESFARSLYPSADDGKLATKAAEVFTPALTCITQLLGETASSWIKANSNQGNNTSADAGDSECQLLSSAALCVYRLVTILKARCLQHLPSIVKPLVTCLQSINILMGTASDQAAPMGKFLQLSILRTLSAVAETLPQFLLPYLPLIFSSNALPSRVLHEGLADGENSVRAATEQVELALATRTPIRQLIPALSQAIGRNLVQSENDSSWEEASAILCLMKSAVESSQRSELSPIIGKIFNGLVTAYGYKGNSDESRSELMANANKCLMSLVMKLSEAQLRPLYARLREWRGDIQSESEMLELTSIRRTAFWNLSAELSKSLRSIFLPCLTSVITDVVDELEIAVSLLCQGSKKKTDGSKRLRVEEAGGSRDDIDKVRPLQSLLLCLELSLKADAHEGGDWTRGDDNQRYNMILSHLGKLLLSQVPSNMPINSDLMPKERSSTSNFQQLVQGVGTLEHGNVAGCLTALAAAAGNEQLWKPLNFAVLEACGHRRSEVRKAGISCLLSIIETIGEEYMVLLPECLPVLSELLEDGDEEIAGMAKECVRQGEELLGESLEESLR